MRENKVYQRDRLIVPAASTPEEESKPGEFLDGPVRVLYSGGKKVDQTIPVVDLKEREKTKPREPGPF